MGRLFAAVLFLFACRDDVESPADGDASCRSQFGEAPEYRDCGDAEEGCAFHTAGAYRTCGKVCDELGGACQGSYMTENGCDRASGNLGCEHPWNQLICVCLP